MAAERKCCVPSCGKQCEDNVILHKFPNPKTDQNRYRTWSCAVGGNILVLDDDYVYKYRRVCHEHFDKSYWLGNKLLSNIAVPTLQLKVAVARKTPLRDVTNQSDAPTIPHAEASTSGSRSIAAVFQDSEEKTDSPVLPTQTVPGMAEDQEVDVQLFITCRLCLDEPGLYQIIPQLRAQINYCFGIDIDPFDGLPQLICKKCKGILNEYYSLKNKFEEKQIQLRDRSLKHNKVAQPVELIENGDKLATPDIVVRSNGETLADVTNAAPYNNNKRSPTDAASNGNSKKKRASWKKAYNEHFVCTICSKSYLTEKSVKKHMTSHKAIMRKHKKVFKKYVTIELKKIDKKKNSTGRAQHVVYDKNKIISKRVNSNYHSFYLKKGFEDNNESDENDNVVITNPNEGKRRLSDSSDEILIQGKKRKTRRLFSNSSSDTVVLNVSNEDCNPNTPQTDKPKTPNTTETVDAECIHLDDTSSDSVKPEIKKVRVIQPAKAEVCDYKSIQNIVTMCHKNHIKKIQAGTNALNEKPSFSESSLKHKVLSLGRKVINKQGFSCTGILRYMEYKDLAITWKPTSVAMQNKGPQFVRIMSKLKSPEDSENEDAGWKNINDVLISRDSSVKSVCETLAMVNKTVVSEPEKPLPPGHIDEISSLAGTCETSVTCKAPVANLKQTIKLKPIIKPLVTPMLQQTDVIGDPPAEDSNMCMPIITSTTSLSEENKAAPVTDVPAPRNKVRITASSEEKKVAPVVDVPVSCIKDKITMASEEKKVAPVAVVPTPRIKVKPASELMTERALSSQGASDDIWAFNVKHSSLPLHLTPTAVNPVASTSGSHSVAVPDAAPIPAPVSDKNVVQSPPNETNRNRRNDQNLAFVILNCSELPNTRTEAPFQYFRTLLLFHELQLLDLNEELSEDFHCLVRFKLLLKQHTKKTITVLLSLFCSNNKFCFTFKDSNFTKFDPNKLPAFWQWELLKVYKGDVVDKILLNASKVGKEVYEVTKHFLCLLKSIDMAPAP